jgi:RsiW-degrading membrane proteinase PrsW (M82 family)
VSLLRRRWLQMLLSGIVLLFLVERTLIATSSLNYVPSVILLGAFLVPITFVTYLYERLPSWDVSLLALAVCFLWGGVLGTVIAGTLEYDVARALGFLPKLAIGLIEESAKLIVPLGFYFLGRYRSEAAGIILGVTTAAGFAALETMGYGFVSLLGSKGNLGILDEVLLVRGLSSPAGHMSWTGLVCAVLWRERLKVGHATLNWRVGGAFLTAVVLHALWDTFVPEPAGGGGKPGAPAPTSARGPPSQHMMTTSLFIGERGEEVSSEAQLPAELAKGGWLLLFLLLGWLYRGVSERSE